MSDPVAPLTIGTLIYPDIDQIDVTGPFEVLSRLPDARHRLYAQTKEPVRDIMGLRLSPDATLAEAAQLDILHIPGGPGQEALMEDQAVLDWIRQQAGGARWIFSVCTGALLLGAAGLLQGRRATTHWAALHLLPFFGAIPVDARVVTDDKWIFAAGVTAGIDGALQLAAALAGEAAAQRIQLEIAYVPEPPFDSGSPDRAPPAVLRAARDGLQDLTRRREITAQRIGDRLGVDVALAAR